MQELNIGPDLVGSEVQNATRPEWGIGKVLRVQKIHAGEPPAHRVSIQFATGHRVLLVPPARLIASQPEPEREAGWLDGVGKNTLNDRLRELPDQLTQFLGSPLERLATVTPLYSISDDSGTLLRWARSQTGVVDPLAYWTRDELLAALSDFCNARDAYLRNAAALLKLREGSQALEDALAALPSALHRPVLEALQRPI